MEYQFRSEGNPRHLPEVIGYLPGCLSQRDALTGALEQCIVRLLDQEGMARELLHVDHVVINEDVCLDEILVLADHELLRRLNEPMVFEPLELLVHCAWNA